MADNLNKNLSDREKRLATERRIADMRLAQEIEETRAHIQNLNQKITLAIQANDLAKQKELTEERTKAIEQEQLLIARKYARLEEEITKEKRVQESSWYKIKRTAQSLSSVIEQTMGYLMQNDKIIRQTTLNLGLSGQKAAQLRSEFVGAASFTARLGGSMADLQIITEGYANETGRARALTEEALKDIFLMGRGTGLGVENATRLAGQFEIIGISSGAAMEHVQGIVETSERMGINTTKVLKNITDNFKRLQTFTFIQGVKGFGEMAMHAEKMRIDMSQALDAAERTRTLEAAIDLAAQLQIMGGEFAKTDPFQLLFLARNDPAEFSKKINDMTKGVVSFRKMADGSFERFISPVDIDRLKAVERSLGMSSGQLIEQAHRYADIQKIRQQMLGTGLSSAEKEMVEGIATFNNETGKFQTKLGRTVLDIGNLNSRQLQALKLQESSLEQRAKDAQTFDDAFKATIEELKTLLLPMLIGINKTLEFLRPIAITLTEWMKKMADSDIGGLILKGAGIMLAAGFLIKKAVIPLVYFGKNIANTIGRFASGGGGFAGGGAATTIGAPGPSNVRVVDGVPMGKDNRPLNPGARRAWETGQKRRGATTSTTRPRSRRMPVRGRGVGGAAGIGAGIGAGAAGIGVGIGAAALGISELAKSLNELDPAKEELLMRITKSLGWFVLGGALVAAGIIGIGMASNVAAPGLLTLGTTAILVGGGIGIAAAGIGLMAMGLSNLVESAKGTGPELVKMAGGVGLLSMALSSMMLGGGGLLVFSRLLNRIAKYGPEIRGIGEAFGNIRAVMSGSEEDFKPILDVVRALSDTNIKGGSVFAELKQLLSKPLKFEFADKNVAVVSNITLEIDGEKLMEKNVSSIARITQEMRQGKRSSAN
jgi:hypothetical protein